jgi:hypothetical protein
MRTVRVNGVQGAMVLLMVLLLTAGCARRINVDVEGGSASGVDWRIGIPF